MSLNKNVLKNKRTSLFKPKIRKLGNEIIFSNPVKNFDKIKEYSNTNIESDNSFRYGNKKGLVSTQELNIDFSKFENHTFFHSAVAKTNEAFDKIINHYPIGGDQKKREEFEDELTGFEKYIYDSFPKNIGYLNFSGSAATTGGTFISVKDGTGNKFLNLSSNKKSEYVLNPKKGSFTFEFFIKIPEQINSNQVVLQRLSSVSNNITVALESSSAATTCNLIFSICSGSKSINVKSPMKKGNFNHVVASYDKNSEFNEKLELRVNIDNVITSSSSQKFNNLNYGTVNTTIASGSQYRFDATTVITPVETFSGSLDELRYFNEKRKIADIKRYKNRNLNKNKTTGHDNNLVFYYKFNEPTGNFNGNNVVLDSSGNSLHQTISNFNLSNRITGSDAPVKFENIKENIVLFPSYPSISTLNQNLMTTASFYDNVNPNLITKLVPSHYFLEGNEEEDFNTILGTFNQNITAGQTPGSLEPKSAQLLTIFLLIWAKYFDELKMFIDTVSNLKNLEYNDFNVTPDKLLPEIGRINGIDLPALFKGANVDQLIEGVNLEENASNTQLSLLKIQNTIWKQILVSLPYLRTTKGTLESVKSVFRSTGIEPDNLFTIREYGGNSVRNIDESREKKIDVLKFLNFSGSLASVTSTNDSQGRPDNKPTLKSGFLSGSRTQFGEPKIFHDGLYFGGFIDFKSTTMSDYVFGARIQVISSDGSVRDYMFSNSSDSDRQTGEYYIDGAPPLASNHKIVRLSRYGLTTPKELADELVRAFNLKTTVHPNELDFNTSQNHVGKFDNDIIINDNGKLLFFLKNPGKISFSKLGTSLSNTILEVSDTFSNGFVEQSPFYHGISTEPNHGLFTTGSFTYEGQYYFNKSLTHATTQSLARLHTTGSYGGAGHEHVISNLTYNKAEKILKYSVREDPSTTAPIVSLQLNNLDMINNEIWNVSFGYERYDNTLGAHFLRAGRSESGKIYDLLTTSSLVTRPSDSVFCNISSTSNPSGSFVSLGIQNIGSFARFLNNHVAETNFSGMISNVRFYSKANTVNEFRSHIKDPHALGVENPLINYLFENNEKDSFQKLRLQTDSKQATTTSDTSGNFRLFDFTQNDLHLDGAGFEESKIVVNPIYKEYSALSSNFDISIADSKIRIRSLDNQDRISEHKHSTFTPVFEVMPSEQTIDDPRFSIDMSVMKGLNEQIMRIFSDFDFLSNALGETNLLFTDTYPELKKLRELYFNNVLEQISLGRYNEIFKWIDNALTELIADMLPHTTDFKGINLIYENHVLDRNKFKYYYDQIYRQGDKLVSLTNSISEAENGASISIDGTIFGG